MVVEFDEELFPNKLRKIKPKVERLFVKGDISILSEFGLAVIGSRNSSKEGERITDEFVGKLSGDYNINIISGLALGIDSRAHRACLACGGKTIAVIGSGFNHVYPKENHELFKKIIESGGVVVSEYPPDTEAKSEFFPMRNRIVSGLSDGVLMIEGKYRSGTTITAKCALKQGKPVFCLPHSIYNAYGTGPNSIIRSGGRLIVGYNDIVDFYKLNGVELTRVSKKSGVYDDAILDVLADDVLSREEIARRLKMPIAEVNQRLTMLELDGLISEELRERI